MPCLKSLELVSYFYQKRGYDNFAFFTSFAVNRNSIAAHKLLSDN